MSKLIPKGSGEDIELGGNLLVMRTNYFMQQMTGML